MDIVTFKGIALLSILAVAVVGGLIPLVSAKSTRSERFFSFGNAFAGGLFLSIALIHLLPEGMQMLSRYSDFPWGAVIATAGFTTLFLDRILIRSRPSPGTMLNEDAPAIYPHVLLMMLSIHAIVEGIALGLEAHVAGAMAMFIGIVLHKGPAAFALILSLHVGGVGRSRQKVSLVLFGIMTPIGILVGLLSSVLLASTTDVYVMLQGGFSVYAAGTFIYIAAIDIIDRELSTDQTRIARYSGGGVAAADAASEPDNTPLGSIDKVHAHRARDRVLRGHPSMVARNAHPRIGFVRRRGSVRAW